MTQIHSPDLCHLYKAAAEKERAASFSVRWSRSRTAVVESWRAGVRQESGGWAGQAVGHCHWHTPDTGPCHQWECQSRSLTLCPRGLDGPSDNNSQPPHPPAIYCSEESNMMRDRGGRGNIWFIWKGPRVNRSCGTAAKFPGAQLVDVCGTPHPSTGGTRGRQRGTEPKNMRGNQKDIKAKRSMPVR